MFLLKLELLHLTLLHALPLDLLQLLPFLQRLDLTTMMMLLLLLNLLLPLAQLLQGLL